MRDNGIYIEDGMGFAGHAPERKRGVYSVMNGKLFRDGATARIEVLPTIAARTLNELLVVLHRATDMAAAGATRIAGGSAICPDDAATLAYFRAVIAKAEGAP